MKTVVENIFLCLVLFWKCYFLTKFSHFLGYLSASKQILLQKISKLQPNPNPRNKSQSNPNTTHHRNSNSTHGSKLRQSKATTTKTPLPHHHNNKKNQNHRGRSVGRRFWVEGEITRRQDRRQGWVARSNGTVRSCDRRDRCDLVHVIVGLELGVRRRCWRRDLGFLSLCASDLKMIWSKNFHSNHFRGQSLILPGQLQITFGKFIFHT